MSKEQIDPEFNPEMSQEELDAEVDLTVLPEPEDELEKAYAEADELRDRLMRSLADAENMRKRAERDRRDAEAYGGSKLARDLMSVYDNMNRALETVDDSQRAVSGALIEGIELTQRELMSAFSKHQIKPITPMISDKFNPQLHQAMFEAPIPGVDAGCVGQVMAVGFMIADRLLRPAQVGVSAGSPV